MNKEMQAILMQVLQILLQEKKLTKEEGQKAMELLGDRA